MTPKEKFEDIDMSKLPEKAVEKLNIVKPYLFQAKYQTEAYKEDRAEASNNMNTLYGLIAEKYPESIKSKVAKAPEPKTPKAMAKQVAQANIVQPKKGKSTASAKPTKRADNMLLAKKIYKKGEETWQEAIKRANKILQEEKAKAVKNANKQYKKLQAFLAKHPMKKGATDIERDAPRKALPIGKRTAKSGKTYYEYRENRTDRNRKGYPYLALGGKLHGAGMFAKGGEMNQSKAKKIFAEFEKNEDENYHSENVVLLAKHFGTAAELKEAKAILKEHDEAGSLTSALRKRRDSLYDKLMPKLRNALKDKHVKGGKLHGAGMFAKGGELKGRIKVGTFDEAQLRSQEDKKAVEKAQKETGLKYVDTKIIKKGGEMFMEVYLIPTEEYLKSSKFAKGGKIESEINQLYQKSNFINNDFNWRLKLLEMLQDNSIEAYNIYQKLTAIQKKQVLQEQFEMDNDMGSYGDGDINTSKENLDILLNDAKKGKHYAKGGKMGFKGLSAKVAARYKGKSVPAKYRKEYGTTYDKAEAKEVGNKVAAKVYRQQLAKK
jgi:hypothetical protein